ncbi:hypothetical protein D9M70_441040 [compost metagenome]
MAYCGYALASESGDSLLPIMNSPEGTSTNFIPSEFSITVGDVTSGPVEHAGEIASNKGRTRIVGNARKLGTGISRRSLRVNRTDSRKHTNEDIAMRGRQG